MTESDKVVEVYFDESGYTGEDTAHKEQQKMLFAGPVIPASKGLLFFSLASNAWRIAGRLLRKEPREVELKGEELYGGRETFEGVSLSDRKDILDAVFHALEYHGILVCWDGAPKFEWEQRLREHGLTNRTHPLHKSWLFGYCHSLYEFICRRYPVGLIHIIGDENSLFRNGQWMVLDDTWHRLPHHGVEFLPSKNEPGLQIADILVHTLYRSNKDVLPNPAHPSPTLTNTDRLAVSYREKLSSAGLWRSVVLSLDTTSK